MNSLLNQREICQAFAEQHGYIIVGQMCIRDRIIVIDEQKELLRQLRGIGGNINRLTVLANMGKVQVIGLDKAAQELSEVSAALRAVMEGR